MSRRHALVVHTRMPAFDRDSGSQDIDNTIRWLLDAGWSVTFLAREEATEAEERHAQRLRRLGVATYAGFDWAERVVRSSRFDLAVIAFWELAAVLLPIIRERSPGTRVVVNSMDVHFLRDAREAFATATSLGEPFGRDAARELSTYDAADAVIAVSEKERALLGDFIGDDRVFTVPVAESIPRSSVPLGARRGMYFVGNFRHRPNREAVAHLANDVLPLLDPHLVERHPLTVLGNWLDKVALDVDPETPGLELVGWVPSIRPYLERSRIAVVPLLHGAGVKRKVLQAMMAGVPVVTTPTGAEGLGLVSGEHALIATGPEDIAAGITRLLTDDDLWHRLSVAGADHVDAHHRVEVVRERFDAVVDTVMARPHSVARRGDDRAHVEAVRRRIQTLADPGAVVLVASGGDDALVDLGSQPCWHFPQGSDGSWPGFEPVDGAAAVNHLESQRRRGARYLVLPKRAFRWRHRYPELHEHLETAYRRIHQDEHLVVYDLSPLPADEVVLEPVGGVRALVVGTYAATRTGPPPALVAELGASGAVHVEQRWASDAEAPFATMPDDVDADYVVFVRDDAVLPSRFLEELLAVQATLGVDRLQPTHTAGPDGGPPVTERHRGTIAREVDGPTPLPVLSVKRGASLAGPVALADLVTVGLRTPIAAGGAEVPSDVRRVWVADPEGHPACWTRPEPDQPPRISVLVTTYNRGELLGECLSAFVEQTLPPAEYEVVVVDDGSDDLTAVDTVVEKFADQMQVTGLRIAHAGRSAAKNLAVLLARAPIVLFFDDDDRPAADYLERHLAAHDAKPAEGVAILGHTDWAPELTRSPLMRYVADVERLLFAYERLADGQELDWRGFWEGRISCKRSLLVRHGLHDQRLVYSIDVELGWRLAPHGLRVVYDASARSYMARPLDLGTFCARTQAKGRAHAVIAALHPGTDIASRLITNKSTAEHWEANRFAEDGLRRRAAELEAKATTDTAVLDELHATYKELFRLLHGKGMAEATGGVHATVDQPTTVQPFPGTDLVFAYDGTPPDAPDDPVLSITIPVWSRTPELADMARQTIERIWEVARLPTEVVVVDNGSPYQVPLAARVHRYPENKGVATGWNTGIRLCRAPVFVVLNSDCRVEPGWDEALYEAATDGRRIAFPYTDHCDGRGFVRPDQGGTAGWCFMMTRAIYDEVGVFDEWFNPAFLEDTDYWHRAWQLRIELTPVPGARVVHARRTTASTHPRIDWLLQGHRYKYGWKHGVDPHRAPPYYKREIHDYVPPADP